MTSAPSPLEIGGDGPRLLVVGVDTSVASLRALAYATGMARRGCGELMAVRMVPSTTVTADGGVILPPDIFEGTFELADETGTALDENLPGRWRIATVHGDAATELERVAEESRADAIVVGRSADSARRLLGSVPRRLVRHARHPVIVVP